ncbi:SusC/RagA family TonB-linked outer membrane protein [Alistipes sp. OttesenSCG-928-B03]|nr:SusC/RagA family TonB-linked outer membrane protein [Alistipes sp. OttesenSCG-928-B03]
MKRNLLCGEKTNEKPRLRPKSLIIIALFAACASFPGALHAQTQQRISLELKATTIEKVVSHIRETTRYRFSYRVEDLPATPARDYKFTNSTIGQVMNSLLDGTSLEWSESNGTIVIAKRSGDAQRPGTTQSTQSQNITLTGAVKDPAGAPIAGVTVILKGTSRGTATDANGRFSLSAPQTSGMVLVFSFLGMQTCEVAYTGQEFNVSMEASTHAIEDVVVTGIFQRDVQSFSGSHTTLSGKEIRELASDNVLTALAIVDPSFKMNVSNLSGSNPTAIPDYQMRGQASIDGSYTSEDSSILRGDYNSRPNQPLFVLDGIIGVSVTSIMDLDPEQVESITLLKDAAAAVIYGSDAANGVVVVETRKPQPGQIRITYNGNYGLAIPDFSDYNLVTAAEKLQIEELAGHFNDNYIQTHQYHTWMQTQVQKGVNTDWLAKPVRNAFTHRHGINFEGGDNTFRYKVYLGASFQPGVMKETTMDTQSARVDLQYRMGKLMIINQTFLDFGKGIRESSYGTFDEYAKLNPYYSVYDENGNIAKILDYELHYSTLYDAMYNPMYNTLYDMRNEVRDQEIKESLKLQYSPLDNLRLELDFTMTKRNEKLEIFYPAQHTSMHTISDPTQKGSYSKKDREESDYRVSLTASYNKEFADAHMLSLYGRFVVSEDQYNVSTLTMLGFPNDKLSEIFMGTTFKSILGDENITRKMGFIFTGSYSYKQRYAVDLSASIDGSSQFGKNSRFAKFWSGGARWNIHNEEFVANTGIFDQLVLRGSYGITGSNAFDSYQALQMYTYTELMRSYRGSDVVGAELKGMGNPDLKWQQTDNYNTAFEFGVLDGRVSGRVEYYYKYTKNALLDFTLAPSTGFASIRDNLGSISNRGIEFSLRVTPYKNVAKQAYWNITFNAARNKSKIEKISDALKSRNEEVYADSDDKDDDYLTKPLPQYVNGQSMTAIWGLKSAGIDPQTGREIYYTRGGGTTAKWTSNNVVVIGDREPKLAGSIATQFGYKNFSLTIAASYTIGGDIYNSTLADKVENANLRYNVDKRVLTERWKEPGDMVKFKALKNQDYTLTNATSRFVMTNNQFKLSTINLSYRMSKSDHRFMKELGLSSATVGLYFVDVLRLSSVKMERGIYYPFAHQISMSLNLSF